MSRLGINKFLLFQKDADDDKRPANGSDKQQTDLWSLPFLSPSFSYHKDCLQSSQQAVPWGILELLTWPCQQFPAVSCQERVPCPTTHPDLDVVTCKKLKEREKSLTTTLFPKDCLPLVIKPVSYTTDDIIIRPVDNKRELSHGILYYENHAITVLSQCPDSLQQSPDNKMGLDRGKDSQPKSAADSVSTKQNKRCARRHSVCVSNPASCDLHVTDTLLCSTGPGLNGVLCSAESQEPSGGGGQGPNLDQLRAVEAYFIERVSLGLGDL